MYTRLKGILFPRLKVRNHIDFSDPVKSNYVKLSHGLIVFRGIACGNYDPAFGDPVISEGLSLKELKHGRRKSLRDTVYLIYKQYSLPDSCLFHIIIDRGDYLRHGILGHSHLLSSVFLSFDIRKSYG